MGGGALSSDRWRQLGVAVILGGEGGNGRLALSDWRFDTAVLKQNRCYRIPVVEQYWLRDLRILLVTNSARAEI